MTIEKIANKVAFYLRKSRSSFIDDGGDDVIISALNNARVHAERLHDFAPQQASVGLVIDPADGGDVINESFYMDGDTISSDAARVKSIDTGYIQDTTNTVVWYPLLIDPKRLLAKKAKEQNYKFRGFPSKNISYSFRDTPLSRFGDDPRNYLTTRPFRGYWQGDRMYLDPRPTNSYNASFDAQVWMDEYTLATQSSDEDWMCVEGTDYLIWYAVCECNLFAKQFVQRQDGYLAPPEKARDLALQTMILKDDYMWENAREQLLIR